MAKIWKEDKWFIAEDLLSGVTTQGRTLIQAKKNFKEAVELYLGEELAAEIFSKAPWLDTIFMPMQVNYGKVAVQ